MGEVEQVLEAMRTELGLSPGRLQPLCIQAWNSHFRVELDARPHHLVIYKLPDPNAISGLVFEHRILRHLQSGHFDLIPRLVIVNRESLFSFEGGRFSISEWLDGCRREDDPRLSPAQIRSMAEGLCDLHRQLRSLDLTLDYHQDHVFVYPLPAFMGQREQLVARLEDRLGTEPFDEEARAGWRQTKYGLLRFLDDFPLDLYWQVVKELRAGIVHGDFRGRNAAFEGDRLTQILDFNCCFNELRLWDVAYTALGLGGRETVGFLEDLHAPAAFIRAYHQAGRLTRQERRLLPWMLGFVVAKLIVGAVESWWITDRVEMFEQLSEGAADEILSLAGIGTRAGDQNPPPISATS